MIFFKKKIIFVPCRTNAVNPNGRRKKTIDFRILERRIWGVLIIIWQTYIRDFLLFNFTCRWIFRLDAITHTQTHLYTHSHAYTYNTGRSKHIRKYEFKIHFHHASAMFTYTNVVKVKTFTTSKVKIKSDNDEQCAIIKDDETDWCIRAFVYT